MKKIIFVLALILLVINNHGFAADSPSCVFIKFSNDTRYKNVDTANILSDLVLEKLLATSDFNFYETNPIDEDLEAKLYDIKTRELANATNALNSSNLNALFEGPGFSEVQAQTVGTATVGQIIEPSITSKIGREHNAEYLIQGNIINLGNGAWDMKMETQMATAYASIALAMAVNPVFMLLNPKRNEVGIGIQTDLRIIKADTGEVIWRKIVVGKKTKSSTQIGGIKFGSSKITSEIYNQAVDDAAQKIVDALIEDFKTGKLFLK